MPVLNSQENLSKIFQNLKHEDKRKKAAEELREVTVIALREFPKENLDRFMSDINRRFSEWTKGNDNMEKLGAIIAIDHLIDLELEGKANRFYNYLWHLLPYDDPLVLIPAARTLGHLAKSSSILTAELIDTQVEQALEWVQSEYSRLASVLVLRELAVNAPTLIYAYISRILDLIWFALRDPRNVIIRDNAADCLSQCLQIVQQRETPMRKIWYARTWEEAIKTLNMNYAEAKHGSLLALRELLLYAGSFMTDMYKNVCDVTLKLKDSKDHLIKKTVVLILPTLAYYNPVIFSELYLNQSISFLLSIYKKTDEKSDVFITIGKIALHIKGDTIPHLDSIVSCIKETLSLKDRRRKEIESSIFDCISMLVTAVGQILATYLDELLNLIFRCNLSKSLIDALVNIEASIKTLSPIIQERLLDAISTVLCGHLFQVHEFRRINKKRTEKHNTIVLENKDNDAIITALSALRSFEFSKYPLDEFIRTCILVYLENDVCEIRKEAVVTICSRFLRDMTSSPNANIDTSATKMLREVMGKLLDVGITDPDPLIRKTVFSSIEPRFYRHLSQADHLNALFMALNDEVFEIRELSITIIGRLALMNPAYVLPSLRQTLIQLLTELEYSIIDREKEESAKLIGLLIKNAPSISKPYSDSILKGLLSKITESLPNLVSAVLGALGELAQVCGTGILPHLDSIMPIIIDTLQDQSSSEKRYAALNTLSHIIRSTGFVIEPYIKYPALLSTFIHILKTEENSDIRREAVKVMGIIGALDPNKYKKNSIEKLSDELMDPKLASNDVILLMMGIKPSSPEEYYPQVVMHSLMKILKDASLSSHHQAAIIAIMDIYKTLGLKVVQFLPLVIPEITSLIRSSISGMLEIYFHKLGDLVSIVKLHIRNHLDDVLDLIDDYWKSAPSVQITIVTLIESIASSLKGEIKPYLSRLIPRMLHIFYSDLSERRVLAAKVLHAFTAFDSNMEEYIHLVVPVIVKSFENHWVRRQAIFTMTSIYRKIKLRAYASRVIHPLVRVIPSMDTRTAAMDLLCELILQLDQDYVKFIPIVNKTIRRHGILHTNYNILVSKLVNKEKLPQSLELNTTNDREDETLYADLHNVRNPPINQRLLKKAWETSQQSTKEDWMEWIRRLNIKLLEQSPSHALRACVFLAIAYPPLARELFNAAFISCWKELYDNYGDELIASLKTALTAPNTPPEIIQMILQLAEFMEHDNKMLPIDINALAIYAQNCHAYAKALHYKEIEFRTNKSFEAVEMLMSINNLLQQPDTAMGILTFAQDSLQLEHKISWYEKLRRYQDALDAYERSDSDSFEVTLGKMRCLQALGEWDQLSTLAQEKWMYVSTECKMSIAPFATAAAWGLQQWDQMEEYIRLLKPNSPDNTFFNAILAVHHNRYKEAEKFINKTRDLLDTEITALLGEGYSRSYESIVRIQMISELEELIIYKQSDATERNQMKQTWIRRLEGCEHSVDVWERILRVRSMVLSPQEDINTWIKYSNLCRKNGRFSLSEKILRSLYVDNGKPPHPKIVYAQLKHIWASASISNSDDGVPIVRNRALSIMREFTTRKIRELGVDVEDMLVAEPMDLTYADSEMKDCAHILSRCYLKQGEWERVLASGLTEESIPKILNSLLLATRFDKNWYKAWHTWALTHFDIIEYNEQKNKDQEFPESVLRNHMVTSIHGFFQSIGLSNQNALQDILRLLRLWFKYGHQTAITHAIRQGFNMVNIDVWLQVIPQLIARIDAPNVTIRLLVHELLTDIGREHPQALVYPLMVSSKSMNVSRKRATYFVIDKMRIHSAALIDQALMVSQELLRVSILWYEMWHKAIEEASRFYFTDRNIEAMLETLKPLYEQMEKGPETRREMSFIEAYGRELKKAYKLCRRYKETQNGDYLESAWVIYYQIHTNIEKYLRQLNNLELQYISPLLLNASNLDLAVPGYYHSGQSTVQIAGFRKSLSVIPSKQRPRQLTIIGSDGKDYMYLLKGNEDLRLDERVMQLLGLINTLLKNDTETFKRHLHIERYSVVPLSPNSGLIGWLPDTETLHSLICEYRESKGILLNVETRFMLEMAPNYEQLSVIQKVEVFQAMLDRTSGQDLYQMLWLKSRNSEAWLERRTNYVRSLAVMSIVGYILGLGDRHPSNLMLHRVTGKVIHIDFGDCFEVTMHRERFPEKIPFRLTRMLIKAMEVSGIEGNFRITCEHVMRVLRRNKDSLMAVLEAFVYDPLISWRLLHNQTESSLQDDHMRDIDDRIGDNGTYNSHRGFSMSRRLSGHEAEAIAASENIRTPEVLNTRAVTVMERVSNKLTGRDFDPNEVLDTSTQVNKLIQQAVSLENLCQCFVGWCPFW